MNPNILDKKKLIVSVYNAIKNKYGYTGEKQQVETQIEVHIKDFTTLPGNKCIVCFKPNWELLAAEYGIDAEPEFENGKCGYCKLPQPKKTSRWIFTEEVWKTL